MKNVLVTLPVKETHQARIRDAAQGCNVLFVPGREVTEEQVSEANVIIGNVPAKMIRGSERLELLQLESAGADAYLTPGILSESTVLCNATGAYNRTVSEHAVALTLMLMVLVFFGRRMNRRLRRTLLCLTLALNIFWTAYLFNCFLSDGWVFT